ncbi:MAG: ABC transporter substrate-binding protein [Treponema sp.]|jgi:ABC-type glycerol-3-phosphate transport system substrate-binding protein|nr:ABC transporter substrate-binding protein [Treponema sp.]
MKRMSFFIIVVMTLALAGCNRQGGSASGTQTVKMAWTMADQETVDPVTGIKNPSKVIMENVVSKVTGYNIEITWLGSSNWIQQLETLTTSGEVDVARFTNQVMVPQWFDDLTPYIQKSTVLGNGGMEKLFSDYTLNYIPYHTFDIPEATGQIFGLPYELSQSCVSYDAEIFRQWGVEPPQEGDSFEILLEKGRKVHGTNPVTGKQNYGMYIRADRTEFIAISFDAWLAVRNNFDMNIRNFDKEKYVESIKTSSELLNYFNWLAAVVELCPPGITTNAGAEKWMTEDNDIAIHLHPSAYYTVFNYYKAKMDNITSRFKFISYPVSSEGQQGFPEFDFLGIAKQSKIKDDAWKVVEAVVTTPEILDEIFLNFRYVGLPVLRDPSMLKYLKEPIPDTRRRIEVSFNTGFRTDDYWFFRTPIQPVIAEILAKTITPENARAKQYEEVKKWVENKERLAR